ncbi:HSP20-like chaperone [Calocera viscosa TUFC12733]|uniref:HSP20-like chaperone n=1 Tax=Calocera viscosa (strain TUFC12733) TaxID=1330018 RepID=A0A167MPP2_CALVF|nr:HSP20-like chaperone [Calocera viscosa TUFC12733]
MSLLRYMLNDLRPLVRMLDEPLVPHRFPRSSAFGPPSTFLRDPFFRDAFSDLGLEARQPALSVHEDPGKAYVVEAELPGVRKEDVEVRIAEGGRGLTIEGRVSRRAPAQVDAEADTGADAAAPAPAAEAADSTAVAPTTTETAVGPAQGWQTYESTFSRSVTFPKPVDPAGVKARLENGVLSLTLPQVEERGSVRVDVE